MPLGIRPTVDFVFKLLFGVDENKDLLIHLLNAVLQTDPPIVEVVILNPFNGKEFDDDKLSVVDVKARDEAGVWYIVEVQTSLPAGLHNRLVFYTSEMYSRQLRQGQHYDSLHPAITICFLTRSLFPRVASGRLRFSLFDPKANLGLGDQIQVHLIELSKYNIEEQELVHADWLERWIYFMVESEHREADDLRQLLPDSHYQKATRVLEMVSHKSELRLIYDDRAKAELDRLSAEADARNARGEGREEGRKQGLELGRQEGRQVGLAEGRAEGLAEGLAEGRAEGRAEGEAHGILIGQLRQLERLLGMPETERAILSAMDRDRLAEKVHELEERFNR